MRKTLMLLVPILLMSACSYGIKMDDAARNVRTAWNDDVSGCNDLGKVTVSVMDHVGPVDRNDITVRDELEILARNEAATMHADTVKPLADPKDGSQAWGVYRCGAAGAKPAATGAGQASPAPASSSAVKTYPIGG